LTCGHVLPATFKKSVCEPSTSCTLLTWLFCTWHLLWPTYNLCLVEYGKRTPASPCRQYFAEISSFPNYTDGLLVNWLTCCTFVCDKHVSRFKLNYHSSIYRVKLCALCQSLLCINRQTWRHFLICSDCLSAIQSSFSHNWPPIHSSNYLPTVSHLWEGLLCWVGCQVMLVSLATRPLILLPKRQYRWKTSVWLSNSNQHPHIPLLSYIFLARQTHGPTSCKMSDWQYRCGNHPLGPSRGKKLLWHNSILVTFVWHTDMLLNDQVPSCGRCNVPLTVRQMSLLQQPLSYFPNWGFCTGHILGQQLQYE